MGRLAERMQGLLRPFVLRRLKTEVATQLVPKQHQLHKVPMTPEQARLYADAVAELMSSINRVAPATGLSWAPCFQSVACQHAQAVHVAPRQLLAPELRLVLAGRGCGTGEHLCFCAWP